MSNFLSPLPYLFKNTKTVSNPVIVLPGHKLDFTSPEDLYGLRIGMIFGNGYSKYDKLFSDNIIKSYDTRSDIQLVLLLNTGRIDDMFGNIHVVPYT